MCSYLLLGLMKDCLIDFSTLWFPILFWYFPPIILCRAGFVERYFVNLLLSWNVLFSPSMVIESFAGYSSLGWHLCSLRVCMTSVQAHLAFIVSGEKSGVILICLPLYVTWPFSLTAFNILSLFSAFGVLIIMWWNFRSGPVFGSSVGFLYVHGHLFLKVREVLSYNFADNILWPFKIQILTLIYTYNL